MDDQEFIVVSHGGCFLTHGYDWSMEYPDAKIFFSQEDAMKAMKKSGMPANIYPTEAYAAGETS